MFRNRPGDLVLTGSRSRARVLRMTEQEARYRKLKRAADAVTRALRLASEHEHKAAVLRAKALTLHSEYLTLLELHGRASIR